MAIEIERKFLVDKNMLPGLTNGVRIVQGYLSTDPAVRVRIKGDIGYITVKGKGLMTREEFEYSIPFSDAKKMLSMCNALITKTRYKVYADASVNWEIDFFEDLEGLVIAEIELPNETYDFRKPVWLGEEVTEDESYQNVNLVKRLK